MTLLGFYQIIVFFSMLYSIAAFFIVCFQQPSQEQKICVVFTVFSMTVCLGTILIYFSNAAEGLLVYGTKIRYYGSLTLGIVYLMVLSYLKFKLPKWLHSILGVLLIFLFFLICSMNSMTEFVSGNPRSWLSFMKHWFYKTYSPIYQNGVPVLKKVYGWGHTLYLFVTGAYIFVTTLVFVDSLLKKHHLAPLNSIMFFIILIIPDITFILEQVCAIISRIRTIPIVPIGIFISDFLLTYLVLVRHFCDVGDMANNAFFDFMSTPAFVLDDRNHIVNINASAHDLLPGVEKNMVGKVYLKILPDYLKASIHDLIKAALLDKHSDVFSIQNDEDGILRCNDKVYQPKIYKVRTGHEIHGFVIWFEDVTLLNTYNDVLKTEVSNKTANLKLAAKKIQSMQEEMVFGFSSLAENHDFSTQGHLHRTAAYVKVIAQALLDKGKFPEEINPVFVTTIEQVAPLHDIGKTYIDKKIFNKPGKLDPEEVELMKQHTTLGAAFLENTLKDNLDSLYVKMAISIALRHHEWWNGKGYPGGLKGTDIPLTARIMAVADTFDALVTLRPYKREFTVDEAYDIIQKESGSHFDPEVVDAFVDVKNKIIQVHDNIK